MNLWYVIYLNRTETKVIKENLENGLQEVVYEMFIFKVKIISYLDIYIFMFFQKE